MLSNEYYLQRVKDLINDVYSMPLLYMIGEEHNLDRKTVDKDKGKLYFRTFIIEYLKYEE